MPFGSGYIIDAVASGIAFSALNNLTLVIAALGDFSVNKLKQNINNKLDSMMALTRQYARG
jgi:hypothetical protein